MVDEALHTLHQRVVRSIVVCDPVLKRVVVDGSDVPGRRLQLALVERNLPPRAHAHGEQVAGRVLR